jgi:manganese efflux pump family protein
MTTFLKTVALVASLGLDTFAVAVGLGLSGLTGRERVRFGVAFAAAEGVMPLVGFGVGQVIAGAASSVAPFVAVALLLAVGLYTVREGLEEEGEREYQPVGVIRLLVTAFSVSMDELAVGFSLGLLHVPIGPAVVLIAAQAFVLTLVGTAIGKRVGERFARRAELLSGVVLSVLAVGLLAEKVLGR